MKPTPSLHQQPAVRRLVSEGVLERVLEIREQAGFVEELCGLKTSKRRAQRLLVLLGDGSEKRKRHVLPDHGGRLEQSLVVRREPVDAGSEDRVHRWRD